MLLIYFSADMKKLVHLAEQDRSIVILAIYEETVLTQESLSCKVQGGIRVIRAASPARLLPGDCVHRASK